MNFSNSLQNICAVLDDVQLDPYTPFYRKQVFGPSFLSWDELERVINRPFGVLLETIDKDGVRLPRHASYYMIRQSIAEGGTFFITTGDNINCAMNQLCAEVEKKMNLSCQTHIYGGLSNSSKSFPIHSDLPMNLILQMSGTSEWDVYKQTSAKPGRLPEDQATSIINVIMEPGDLIFIPSLMFHRCVPRSKRFSISIPLIKQSPDPKRREWIKI